MKHTNYAYLIVTLFLLVPACQRISEQDNKEEAPVHVLTAVLEGKQDTKTVLSGPDDSGIYYPYWSVGDAIALYVDGINQPDTYSLVAGSGTGKGSFSGTLFGSHLVALYPEADKTKEGLQDNVLTLELPATQKYVPGSFGMNSFPMLAVSNSSDLSFKNLCSVLKISMIGQESVKSIKFISADSWMPVSGKATVSADFSPEPQLLMADGGSTEVTLECGSVDLDPTTPADFFLVIPPGTYHGGFTLEIQTFNGKVTRSTSKDVTFGRSQFRSIPVFECVGTGEIDTDSVPYNQIWYVTENDVKVVLPDSYFDVPIVSITYENGMGKITFAGPVTEVKSYAFSYKGFTEIHLPDCVTTLGDHAFYNSSITSFRTPESLEKIYYSPFYGCDRLSRFYGKWASEDGRFIILDGGKLAASAPGAMQGVVQIPEGTRSLEGYACIYCDAVQKVIIPEGVESIGNYCFADCYSLETVSLPASLTKIGESLFEGCNNLTKLEGDCDMIWDDGLLLVDSSGEIITFIGKDVEDYVIPEGVTSISGATFANLPNLRSLTFPSTLNNLWSGWMGNCPNLEFFYGPGTSDDHHSLVFYGNYLVGVTPITPAEYVVPAEVTRIFLGVFRDNECIQRLVVPDQVTFAHYYAFAYMPNLKEVVMSASISDLWDDPFACDYSLERVYWRGFVPVTLTESTDDYYRYGADNLVFYVPMGFETLYQQASGWSRHADRIQGYVYEDLESPDFYISTDYSHNGEVTLLSEASEGDGINLILMGDGYSDRQIADGTYDAAMHKMMDAFFSEEPYSTFKNLFNVYAITVVSATEGYDHPGQALGTWFGNGTTVGGNDSKCMELARSVIPEEKMDNSVIIVAMNRDYYAGTCYMYHSSEGDYGNGLSVAYFPTSSDEDTYNGLVRHEAGGHGFAKLADEYAYDQAITDSDKESLLIFVPFGWYKNVDFTNDPAKVKWAHFLQDERYAYDGLGVFEGGATFSTGVWRPTDDSIMRYNQGGFNAPSREAIWYRIHKLAYGDGWAYNYENFVAYDAKNRKTAADAASAQTKSYVERSFEPTHPPVVVQQSWKEAMDKARMSKSAKKSVPDLLRRPFDPNTPVKTSDF